MKTPTEIKFDQIIKCGFHEVLKPIGFKKKANNFYLKRPELGQIINVQKSALYSKTHIKFTINTGIFVPEVWAVLFNFHGTNPPIFPTEPECLVRLRIGELKNQPDTWYNVDETTDQHSLIDEMKTNLENFILPHFEQAKTKEDILKMLDNSALPVMPLGKLIFYGEFKYISRAKLEYEKILSGSRNHYFLNSVREYGKKYGLE